MMKYPKIQTIWKRDEKNKFNIIEKDFSKEEFDSIQNWEVTEKIDGTNIRIMWDGENVRFGGRTDDALIPTFLLTYLQDTFTKEKLFRNFHDSKVTLFGEGYGQKIQSCGKRYRKDNSFILFDVVIGDWWLLRKDVEDIAKKLGIQSVPFLGVMTTSEAVKQAKMERLSEIAEDDSLPAEGIVARSYPLMLFRDGNPIMWKLKAKDYRKLSLEGQNGV